MRHEVWQSRFRWLLRLGIPSLLGLAILLPCIFMEQMAPVEVVIVGMLLFAPGAIYLLLVTMWHWKERYRGEHSDLWGALILLETTGWFKVLYLFRHIIPDARGRGRYASGNEPDAGSHL
jgi:hypothetical protein